MRRATTLEARLVEWGKDYGGGRYGYCSGGGSPLASMMKWHGRAPSGLGYTSSCSAADEVQAAVDALAKEAQGDLKTLVLEKEYLTPGQPLESKLQKIRDDGHSLQRTTYYKQLREARKFVADFLGLEDDDSEDACAA